MNDKEYNPTELLICTASRLMADNTTAFIGTGIPMLAGSIWKLEYYSNRRLL